VTDEPSNSGRGRSGRSAVFILLVVVTVGLVAVLFDGSFRRTLADAVHLGHSDGVQLDAPEFSPGACTAFDPTAGNNGKTVFLDAGHGGIDPGGVGTTQSGQTVEESSVNLAVELDAMALLRAHGYRVVVSRTSDSSVVRLSASDVDGNLLTAEGAHEDVAARDVCANLAGADALVGIYMDASSTSDTAGSVTLYDQDRPFAVQNQRLATLLQTDVLAAMNAQDWQIPNDGALPDSGFGSSVGDPEQGGLAAEAAAYDHLMLIGPASSGYFTTPSNMPGAVIEPLYLTDPFEGSIAANASDQQVIAQGIAHAVESYLN
jgi:N-acetylmuramoyl-L-alanine amidase